MSDGYDEQLILGYVEGELTPEQSARFSQQLAGDPRLRHLIEGLLSDRRRLRLISDEASPDDLMDRITANLERDMLLEPTPTQRIAVRSAWDYRVRRWMAYSGVAAMLLFSGALVMYTLTDDQLTSRSVTDSRVAGKIKGPQESMASGPAPVARETPPGSSLAMAMSDPRDPERSRARLAKSKDDKSDQAVDRDGSEQHPERLESGDASPYEGTSLALRDSETDIVAMDRSEDSTRTGSRGANPPRAVSRRLKQNGQPHPAHDLPNPPRRPLAKTRSTVTTGEGVQETDVNRSRERIPLNDRLVGKDDPDGILAGEVNSEHALPSAPATAGGSIPKKEMMDRDRLPDEEAPGVKNKSADDTHARPVEGVLSDDPVLHGVLRIVAKDVFQGKVSVLNWVRSQQRTYRFSQTDNKGNAIPTPHDKSKKTEPSIQEVQQDRGAMTESIDGVDSSVALSNAPLAGSSGPDLVLVVPFEQIPQLLAELNKPADQTASLAYDTVRVVAGAPQDASGFSIGAAEDESGSTLGGKSPVTGGDTAEGSVNRSRDDRTDGSGDLNKPGASTDGPPSFPVVGDPSTFHDWAGLLSTQLPLIVTQEVPDPQTRVELRIQIDSYPVPDENPITTPAPQRQPLPPEVAPEVPPEVPPKVAPENHPKSTPKVTPDIIPKIIPEPAPEPDE